jgi:methionyl-tRNA formyltransferase
MSELKIILLCSNRFALPAMQQLLFFNQLTAVAIPSQCEELIFRVQHALSGSGVPLIIIDKEGFAQRLEQAISQYHINVGLIMTFGYKLPSSVFLLPEKGFYNVHPGLLPEYRGPDPIFQQIKNKEKFAGITIHKLDEGIDTGPILIKERIPVEVTDTHGLLTTKLSDVAAVQVSILMKLIGFNVPIHSKEQDKKTARYYKRQTEQDVTIHWEDMDAQAIVALINACNPWNKGAVAKMNNRVIRFLDAGKIMENSSTIKEAGYIISFDEEGIIVSTIHNQVILIRTMYADEGFLAANYLKRLGVQTGSRFETS